MHDGGTLDLETLIGIARSERSGEIAPETTARLAQFQAAFDAAPMPADQPTAICFAFHAPVPQGEGAVKYRDVAIDHSKFDYDRIVRQCIAAALAAQPGARFILATDAEFLEGVVHPALTIVRLPLDAASPMYERVIAMCAFVRSRQFNAPTAFLDSDAFLNAPIASLFQGHFDIGATYRSDPGLMPVNEGVIFASSRNKDLVRGFFAGYLGTYDRLCGNAAVTGYYGNIKRWRGGQLSLNALACPPGVPSVLDSAKAFGARIRYYPCSTFNFSIDLDRPYSARQLDTKSVLHLKGPRKAILDQITAYQTQRWPQIAETFAAPKPADPPAQAAKPQLIPEPAQEDQRTSEPASLAEILDHLQIEKSSKIYRCAEVCERYFAPLRARPDLNLAGLASSEGALLKIWSYYFRDVRVLNVDPEQPADGSFDIIINDGSDGHIVAAFHQNWPKLKADGLFVVAGLEHGNESPQARRPFITLFEACLKEMDQGDIEYVHVYREAAVIKKTA